jgi:iron(III) transport system permease protein
MSLAQPSVPLGPAPMRRHRRGGAHPAIVLAALLVAAAALVPVGFIAWVLVDAGWDTSVAMIFRPRVGELLVATLLLELLAVPISVGLALALAWLTERSDLPFRHSWRWLAVAPLAIPAFVQAYAWDSSFPLMRGLLPAVIVSVLAYFPFVYLPVVAQLRRLDPALEDTAASLGVSPPQTFFRVILPQLRLAIAGGAILVALHLLAEYGLYVLIRYDTLTVAIVNQFQAVYDGPAANLLGIVLVAFAMGLLVFENWLRGERRYARVGSGAARRAPLAQLGKTAPLWTLLPLLTTAFAVGLPLVTLGRWLAVGGPDAWDLPELGAAAGQTALYAILGAAIVSLAALPIAWMAVRARSALQQGLENLHFYVGALPGVIVALALVAITVRVALPLYQTVATVLLAYVLLFMPRAIVSVRASLAQVPLEVEQAAVSLGDAPLRAAIGTTLRLAAPGIAAGMALVAMGITTELTATLMLSPIGTETLATQFWSHTGEFDHMGAAPFAIAMILVSIPLCIILHRQATGVSGR